MQLSFSLLANGDMDAAYAIVRDATHWLMGRGLPAWLMPEDVFATRLREGSVFGAFVDGELAGVVSLTQTYLPEPWAHYLKTERYVWLSTLNVARRWAGQGIGRLLMAQSEAMARRWTVAAVYLDCYFGDGALPAYYAALGYEWVERKLTVFDDGVAHDSVLMRKPLSRDGFSTGLVASFLRSN